MDSALLFERDAVEEVDWVERVPRLGRSSVLWIDLEQPSDEEIRRLGDALGLDDESVAALSDTDRRESTFGDFGDYLQVTMLASGRDRPIRVACMVAERWVVTVREAPLDDRAGESLLSRFAAVELQLHLGDVGHHDAAAETRELAREAAGTGAHLEHD